MRWSNGKPIALDAAGVGEHRVRRVLEVRLLRLDRERLPHRLELARGCPSGSPSGPVMLCLSRNDFAPLGRVVGGVDGDADHAHVARRGRRARRGSSAPAPGTCPGRSSTRTRRRPARRCSDALVTVLPSWSVSVNSGTGWPGGRSAPAQPSVSSSPPPSSCRSASSTPATAATAQSVSATSARRSRAGEHGVKASPAPTRSGGRASAAAAAVEPRVQERAEVAAGDLRGERDVVLRS